MISALILAGGRATRMGGIDKTALLFDGETIFARQVRVLAPRVVEIIVSVGAVREMGSDPYSTDIEMGSDPIIGHGFRVVSDSVAGAGPLAGILAGLVVTTTPWMLVVAGDMPHLDGTLIDRMTAMIRDDIDAVGIRIDDLPEPLFCLLRVSAARPAIEQRFAEGKRKASELLTSSGLRVAWLEGVARAALTNINTPDDLR